MDLQDIKHECSLAPTGIEQKALNLSNYVFQEDLGKGYVGRQVFNVLITFACSLYKEQSISHCVYTGNVIIDLLNFCALLFQGKVVQRDKYRLPLWYLPN